MGIGEGQEYGEEQYQTMSDRFISGHIKVPEGHKIVGGKQLRICSSYGAEDSNKVLALVGASKEYNSYYA